MPLLAQTKPCAVSVISTCCLANHTFGLAQGEFDNAGICAVLRGEALRAAADGFTVASSTVRPSALETILCLTTRMSPS